MAEHLHQDAWDGQIIALQGYAWYPTPRRAALEGRAANEPKKELVEGKRRAKEDVDSTEEVETSGKARIGSKGDRADRKKKVRIKKWSDVVKGIEEELETIN